MKKLKRIRFTLLITALISTLSLSVKGQDKNGVPPELNKGATLQETLDWLNQYSFPYMGIGIDDRKNPVNGKTNVAFFKGFKLIEHDSCNLLFRNEGTFKNQAQTPYIVEASIPVTDINPDGASIRKRPAFSPDIDALYGLWRVTFLSNTYDFNILMDFKAPDKKRFGGSIVIFSFGDEESAKRFSKAFRQMIKLCRGK